LNSGLAGIFSIGRLIVWIKIESVLSGKTFEKPIAAFQQRISASGSADFGIFCWRIVLRFEP